MNQVQQSKSSRQQKPTIEEGKFDENESFLSGQIKVADATINDHDFGKRNADHASSSSWSSNVGMVMLEQRLGGKWYNYLQKLGIWGKVLTLVWMMKLRVLLPTANIVDQADECVWSSDWCDEFPNDESFHCDRQQRHDDPTTLH